MHSSAVRTSVKLAAGITLWSEAFAYSRIVIFLSLAIVVGCNKAPAISDNSTIVVQAGLGVTNMCEIGMTFSQIKKATRDATTHGMYDGSLSWRRLQSWNRGRFALVSSFGAIIYLGEGQPISSIDFYVYPYRAPLIPGLEVRVPFRGKVGEKLSFKDGPVFKNEVQSAYGKAERVVTNAAGALALRKQPHPFVQQRVDGGEELWYPGKGVTFIIKSNIVTSFQIYKANGTNS